MIYSAGFCLSLQTNEYNVSILGKTLQSWGPLYDYNRDAYQGECCAQHLNLLSGCWEHWIQGVFSEFRSVLNNYKRYSEYL